MASRGFARVDGQGNLVASSPTVTGMDRCVNSSTLQRFMFGAYCFKLQFTPKSVIASPIAHPNDTSFGPLLYTAGPNLTGPFTKNKNGNGVQCPTGFQDAAVICRVEAGDGLAVPPGGFFVIFD